MLQYVVHGTAAQHCCTSHGLADETQLSTDLRRPEGRGNTESRRTTWSDSSLTRPSSRRACSSPTWLDSCQHKKTKCSVTVLPFLGWMSRYCANLSVVPDAGLRYVGKGMSV